MSVQGTKYKRLKLTTLFIYLFLYIYIRLASKNFIWFLLRYDIKNIGKIISRSVKTTKGKKKQGQQQKKKSNDYLTTMPNTIFFNFLQVVVSFLYPLV